MNDKSCTSESLGLKLMYVETSFSGRWYDFIDEQQEFSWLSDGDANFVFSGAGNAAWQRREKPVTTLQAVLFGIMLSWTPCLLAFAWILWRAPHAPGEIHHQSRVVRPTGPIQYRRNKSARRRFSAYLCGGWGWTASASG